MNVKIPRAFSLVAGVAAIICCLLAPAAEAALLGAVVNDVNGQPVEGVKIFLYKTSNVRMPPDFISSPTAKNGKVSITIPPGRYWAVARLKRDALYGPLMPGDKHSGEPFEVDALASDAEVQFEVADLREIGQKKRTGVSDTIRVWGRVLDKDGAPQAGVYVFADKSREIEFIPEYLSAWTDEGGNYSIYLPSGGKLYLGSSRHFPPPTDPGQLKEFVPEAAKLDVASDIQLNVY